MKPRVMFLVVFTALVGLVAAPGHHASRARHRCPDVHRCWRWRRRRSQHVVRRRYRCAHGADCGAADSARPLSARSQGVWRGVGRWLGDLPWPDDQLACRRAACAHHRLLCFRLHHVAEADDAAEHRHRRRCRRLPADDRLGRGDRNGSLDSVVLFLIIFLWTPPHFWALALTRTRDYERVGIPMLPVVKGRTRREPRFSSIA